MGNQVCFATGKFKFNGHGAENDSERPVLVLKFDFSPGNGSPTDTAIINYTRNHMATTTSRVWVLIVCGCFDKHLLSTVTARHGRRELHSSSLCANSPELSWQEGVL